MKKTTACATRENILIYIASFIRLNGYAPSVREIGAAVGLRSTATVSQHLQVLKESGKIASKPGRARTICIV